MVVFNPGGAFNPATKNEITKKIVEPYLDYQKDQKKVLISFEVAENLIPETKATYPYTAQGIFIGGAVEGFVFGKAIDWWLPECLGPCPLSENFKTKYPEIAKKLGL